MPAKKSKKSAPKEEENDLEKEIMADLENLDKDEEKGETVVKAIPPKTIEKEPEIVENEPEAEPLEKEKEPELEEKKPEAEPIEKEKEPELEETKPEAEPIEKEKEPELEETKPEAEPIEKEKESELADKEPKIEGLSPEPPSEKIDGEPKLSESLPDLSLNKSEESVKSEEIPSIYPPITEKIEEEKKQEIKKEGTEEEEEEEGDEEEEEEEGENAVSPEDKEKTERAHLKNIVEAALFVAGRPISLEELNIKTEIKKKDLEDLLNELMMDYMDRSTAVEIIPMGDKFSMQIKAEYTQNVKKFASGGLIPEAVLKTLTIIAIKQPMLKSTLIKIRGSTAYDHVKFLIDRGFITNEKKGRSDELITTEQFADTFGLSRDPETMKKQMVAQLGVSEDAIHERPAKEKPAKKESGDSPEGNKDQ